MFKLQEFLELRISYFVRYSVLVFTNPFDCVTASSTAGGCLRVGRKKKAQPRYAALQEAENLEAEWDHQYW